MRTAGWFRPAVMAVLFIGIVAGCAGPASWVHRPIAEPPDAGAADAERCEADARVIARPWRASPSVAGWLALDLALLAAEILSATPTKEVAIALGATTLVLLIVEAERWDEPATRQQYVEAYHTCMERRGYRFGPESGMAEGRAMAFPRSGRPGPTPPLPDATGSPR